MSQIVRLELDTIKILKNREKWKLYFMLVTEMPDDPQKLAVGSFPTEGPIQFTKLTDNDYSFAPAGVNTQGLFVMERPMPTDLSINVGLYLMQSRSGLRGAGDIIGDVTKGVEEAGGVGEVVKVFGKATSWLSVANLATKGVSGIGSILEKTKDRNLGYLSMSEDFKDNDQPKLNRSNKLSTGIAQLDWTWVVQ